MISIKSINNNDEYIIYIYIYINLIYNLRNPAKTFVTRRAQSTSINDTTPPPRAIFARIRASQYNVYIVYMIIIKYEVRVLQKKKKKIMKNGKSCTEKNFRFKPGFFWSCCDRKNNDSQNSFKIYHHRLAENIRTAFMKLCYTHTSPQNVIVQQKCYLNSKNV